MRLGLAGYSASCLLRQKDFVVIVFCSFRGSQQVRADTARTYALHYLETLPGSARSMFDTDFVPDTGYFYHIVAVGRPAPIDPLGLAGTPDGSPFRSNRYFTQMYDLTAVGVRPGLDSDTLFANVPNPFTDQTAIQFVANGPAFAQIKVYNTLGQEVALLYDDYVEVFDTGMVVWRGVDFSGRPVSSGVYYCQLSLSLPNGYQFKQTIPMALIR
jgi:hypothetical protein